MKESLQVLCHCLPVFIGCDQIELDSIQIMQNKATRIITNFDIRTSRVEIFEKLRWMTVRQLAFFHTSLCTFRIRRQREPEYLYERMIQDNRLGKIIVPNSRLSLAKKSYCFRGAVQWNKIPADIRECHTVCRFKTHLKSWILQNVPQFANE